VTIAYRFGSLELQPDQRRLLVDGRPVALGSRAFDLLLALVERPGQLVTKNELLDRVWPGLVVEANNLQVQISTLRKLLGPRAIATIPGFGYRWALSADDVPAQSARSESTPAAPWVGNAARCDVAMELPALYGRAGDVSALRELIGHHALVTVVGPAGIGKTRLAEAVAHELRDEFADGAVLVELAQLADADLVAATVARALGIAVGNPQTALDLSVQALAGQRLLLVLDNCEHLLTAVDRMVAALRKGAPRVHILATSQELLRHPDEHVYRLGALALPAEVTAVRAREAGAIELFTARVQAIVPRFAVSDANVAAVVDICRRLDGIPLAIEFAAARVPLLGVEGVRDRLDERFRLLTAGSRSAPRRHQTLHAALEWSYGLLSEQEQKTFDGLGVFVGGFSLESAQDLATDASSMRGQSSITWGRSPTSR
jgi:DNA-binding winged helix-turn-helix (wHTH) protein